MRAIFLLLIFCLTRTAVRADDSHELKKAVDLCSSQNFESLESPDAKCQQGAELAPKKIRAELSTSAAKPGSLVVITVHAGAKEDPAALVGSFGKKKLRFYPNPRRGSGVYEALLPIDLKQKPGKRVVVIQGVKLPFRVVRGKFKLDNFKVDQKFSELSEDDEKRAVQDIHDVKPVIAHLSDEMYWEGAFRLPLELPGMKLTSEMIRSAFGTRRKINGIVKQPHPGIDIRAKEGTPVHAPARGIVLLAKPLFWTGNTVMMDHGHGVITLYAHLSKIDVSAGQKLSQGELIGLVGQTGRVHGAHLHWQAYVNTTKINPLELIRVLQ